MNPEKSPSLPPKTAEEIEADEQLDAAQRDAAESAKKMGKTANGLKRTISDPKMKAVRLPTPSQIELETQPPKQ